MGYAIEVKNLTVSFQTRGRVMQAVSDLNLQVPTGHVFGFLGPNGAGKTTTMHVLLGFIEATSGEARIFDVDVRDSIARKRIGYLQEQPDTYRFMTGRELLHMTGRLFQIERGLLRRRTGELLRQIDMEEASDRRISTYSRGMMQRICLAQALVNDPDLVILDEPTGGLDPFGRIEVRKIIASLKEQGKTVFFSSHELSEVELVCDHIAIISSGKIVAQGKTSELIKPGQSLERYFMDTVKQQ